jgi:hypothetical protein
MRGAAAARRRPPFRRVREGDPSPPRVAAKPFKYHEPGRNIAGSPEADTKRRRRKNTALLLAAEVEAPVKAMLHFRCRNGDKEKISPPR